MGLLIQSWTRRLQIFDPLIGSTDRRVLATRHQAITGATHPRPSPESSSPESATTHDERVAGQMASHGQASACPVMRREAGDDKESLRRDRASRAPVPGRLQVEISTSPGIHRETIRQHLAPAIQAGLMPGPLPPGPPAMTRADRAELVRR